MLVSLPSAAPDALDDDLSVAEAALRPQPRLLMHTYGHEGDAVCSVNSSGSVKEPAILVVNLLAVEGDEDFCGAVALSVSVCSFLRCHLIVIDVP